MSYPHSEPVRSSHHVPSDHLSNGAVHNKLPPLPAADMAIDAALRSVPLPDGLLTRLDQFVHRLTCEPTDSIDYLGC